MTTTMIDIAEMYIDFNLSKEDVIQYLNEHNESYKRFEDLPEEFHEYVDAYEAVAYVRERDEAEILETIRNCE